MGNRDNFRNVKQTPDSGAAVSGLKGRADTEKLPKRLRNCAMAIYPAPRESLEALVDLGLTDSEIARYFLIPHRFVSELREYWKIGYGSASVT